MDDHYLTQEDAELAVGSPGDLREHFKVASSTAIDMVKLNQVLGDTDGDIRKRIGLSFDLDAFDALWFNKPIRGVPAPPIPWNEMDRSGIRTDARKILRYYIWTTGTKNQARPEDVKDQYLQGLQDLEGQGRRLQSLSSSIKPGTDRHYTRRTPALPGKPPRGSARHSFKGFT